MNELHDRFDEAANLIIPQQILDKVVPAIQSWKTN